MGILLNKNNMAQAGGDKTMAKQRNVVIDNEIFREKVRAEKRHAFLNENFDFNPKNLTSVSDKIASKHAASAQSKEPPVEELKNKISTLTQFPKQKFTMPQTSAQEVGWDMDLEFGTHAPKKPFNKKQGPETSYVENFVTFQARSPFL